MNAVSRVSSLSLALPVSNIPVSSSLSFVLFLPFSVLGFRLSHPFSLVLLSRFCPVPRSTLATLLFRDLVSAAAFLFFPPFRPICSPSRFLPSPPLPPPPTLLPTSSLFRRPLRARFSGFSCAPFQPPAYPLRNRSTETCSGVAGTNENATEGNGVAYEIRGDLKERRKKRI